MERAREENQEFTTFICRTVGAAQRHSDEMEPDLVDEALQEQEWNKAMENEFQAFTSNDMWTLVPFQVQNMLLTLWFSKLGADGTIERRKARLVTK